MLPSISSQDKTIIALIIVFALFSILGSFFLEKFKDLITFGLPKHSFDFNSNSENFFKDVLSPKSPTTTESCLKILGLQELPETQEELSKKYYELAHKYHPDMQGGDNKKFIKITKAYKTLKKQYSKKDD